MSWEPTNRDAAELRMTMLTAAPVVCKQGVNNVTVTCVTCDTLAIIYCTRWAWVTTPPHSEVRVAPLRRALYLSCHSSVGMCWRNLSR